jgi:tRNA(fMet)-specific endonuclease VapC
MVCFDTDFLIAYLQKDQAAIRKLEDLQAGGGDTIAITTTVNAAELWKGAYRSKDGQKEAAKVKRLLDSLELITLDRESARLVGELDAVIKSSPIGESDLLIASIAIANKQILITRNKKHFERVPKLQVEGW